MAEPTGAVPPGIADLVERYDLSPPVDIVLVSSGLNDVYRVRSAKRTHALKVYRAGWRTRAEVQAEVDLLLHLESRGVSVARPVAARGGDHVQTLPLPNAERVALLFEEAPGATPAILDARACWRYGEALAQLHTAFDDLTTAPTRCDLHHLLDLPLRALEPLLVDRPEDRAFVWSFAVRLRERIAALPAGALDQGVCHGDFRPANGHLLDDRLTLFDFEVAGWGLRAYDLATFFYALGGYSQAPAAPREAFFDGYAARRPLAAVDRRAADLLIPLRPIRILGTLFQTAHRNRELEPWPPTETRKLPGLFDTTLAFLQEWEESYGEFC